MKFVVRKNAINPKKNILTLRFVQHENPYGVTETRTRDLSGGR